MSTHEKLCEEREETARRARQKALIAFGLLAITLMAGLAARMAGGTDLGTTTGGGDGQLSYTAKTTGPVHFDGRLDRGSVMVDGDGLVNVELVLAADANDAIVAKRMPTDLLIVLDRSGSMRGAPITHALGAVRELVQQLSPEDRFSLISYASGASTTIPLSHAGAEARSRWLATLSSLEVNGGTNMASGLDLAAATIKGIERKGRVARVILLSDGHANEGDHSRDGLVTRASRAVRGEYVLSAVGVGAGFDEGLMTALADAGTGSFYYVQRSDELGQMFASEFASARETVASGLEVSIRPQSGVQVVSAAGYPLEHRDGVVRFRPGALFAGQERRVWLQMRLPVDSARTADLEDVALGHFDLTYRIDGRATTLRLDGAPSVSLVRNEVDFVAQVDTEAWAQAVENDELGELKQKVSKALRSSTPSAAVPMMRSFAARQSALNGRLNSPKVEEVIQDVKEMEASVADAIARKDDDAQNALSKKYSAEGYDGRRQGGKY
jgi:Ca-activated chloride channel family protein